MSVIQNGSAVAARQYAKNGCPSGLRGQVWQQILCLEIDDVVSFVCNKTFHLRGI